MANLKDYTITLTNNLKEIPFCIFRNEFENPKSNQREEVLIYTTPFYAKLLSSSKDVYIDGTFRAAPPGFTQIIILHAYSTLTNRTYPFLFALLSHKSQLLYCQTFNWFKTYAKLLGTNFNFEVIQTDFERGLINGTEPLRSEKTKYIGCWFHYTKEIFTRLKENKLIIKLHFIIINKVLINAFKYFPFISNSKRSNFIIHFRTNFTLNVINISANEDKRSKYTDSFNYIEKNWVGYEQVWADINVNCSFSITNNPAEIFNKKLNGLVGIKSPRLTFLVHTFAILLKELVGKFADQIGSPKKDDQQRRADHERFVSSYEAAVDAFLNDGNIQVFMSTRIIRGENDAEEFEEDIGDWFF